MHLAERIRSSGPKRILALDGGGILGLMSLEVLVRIEDILRERLGRGADFVLSEYFDFVGGTSTGAVIGACVASGMPAVLCRVRKRAVRAGSRIQSVALQVRIRADREKDSG
jgi:predicted acylesterase/phospholipase RssA